MVKALDCYAASFRLFRQTPPTDRPTDRPVAK